MGMEGHHRKRWQVPAGKSTVAVINDWVLNLILRLFFLVVIELHRADINLIIIPDLQKAAVQHLLGKMVNSVLRANSLASIEPSPAPRNAYRHSLSPWVAMYCSLII